MRQFDSNELEFIKKKYGTGAVEDVLSGRIEKLGFTEDELLEGYNEDPRKNLSKRKLIAKPNIPQLVNTDINEDEFEQVTNRIKNLNLSDPGTQPYSRWDYGRDVTQEEFMNEGFSDPSIMFRHYPPEQSEQSEQDKQDEESAPTTNSNPNPKPKPKLIQKRKNIKSNKSKKRNNKQKGTIRIQRKTNSGQTRKNNSNTPKLKVLPARIDSTNTVGYFTNPKLQARYIKIVNKSNHPNDYWHRRSRPEVFGGGTFDWGGASAEW